MTSNLQKELVFSPALDAQGSTDGTYGLREIVCGWINDWQSITNAIKQLNNAAQSVYYIKDVEEFSFSFSFSFS